MLGGFIPPHGGYRKLLSFPKAEIVYDATVYFCDRFLEKRDRTYDQMIQAARSGKQNIIEASQASGTSRETEIKLTKNSQPQAPTTSRLAAMNAIPLPRPALPVILLTCRSKRERTRPPHAPG